MQVFKDKLLETVAQLQDNGVELDETPALFKWSYPEEPFIEFQLLIIEHPEPIRDPDKPLH